MSIRYHVCRLERVLGEPGPVVADGDPEVRSDDEEADRFGAFRWAGIGIRKGYRRPCDRDPAVVGSADLDAWNRAAEPAWEVMGPAILPEVRDRGRRFGDEPPVPLPPGEGLGRPYDEWVRLHRLALRWHGHREKGTA